MPDEGLDALVIHFVGNLYGGSRRASLIRGLRDESAYVLLQTAAARKDSEAGKSWQAFPAPSAARYVVTQAPSAAR